MAVAHELVGVAPLEAKLVIPHLRQRVLDAISHLPTGDEEREKDSTAVEVLLNLLGDEEEVEGVAVLFNPNDHIVRLCVLGADRWSSPIARSLAQEKLMLNDAYKRTHAPVVPMILQAGFVLDDLCGCEIIFDSRVTTAVPSHQPA